MQSWIFFARLKAGTTRIGCIQPWITSHLPNLKEGGKKPNETRLTTMLKLLTESHIPSGHLGGTATCHSGGVTTLIDSASLPMNDLAYRYAHADTFLKMLESQTLWFSDLRRMNDWDEYAAGFRVASRLAAEEFPQYTELLAEISPERMSAGFLVLICSFSLDGDCLSMWRGYGDNGAGASIGYDYREIVTQHLGTRYLAKMAPIQGKVQFLRVMYEETGFQEQVRAYLQSATRQLASEAATQLPEFRAVQLGMLKMALMRLCTLYKNDFFVDERELRGFIEVNEHADPYVLGQRESGFGQADYHQVDTNSFGVPVIREVVLGPRSALPMEEVQAKLISCGLPNVKIRQSRGTYREAQAVSRRSPDALGQEVPET